MTIKEKVTTGTTEVVEPLTEKVINEIEKKNNYFLNFAEKNVVRQAIDLTTERILAVIDDLQQKIHTNQVKDGFYDDFRDGQIEGLTKLKSKIGESRA